MFRVLNAFRGTQETLSQEEKTKIILKQAQDFELALRAMDYVLDDKAEEGLALLNESDKTDGPDQTINVLARGVIEFLEATLSFEPEEMKIASATLARAEQLSLKSKQKAEKDQIKSSSLYPPGTVYAVTYTESCLLHALLMLFSESMMEAAKAVLKLRKAYHTLQDILQQIKKANKKKSTLKNKFRKMKMDEPTTNTNAESGESSSASFISSDSKMFESVDIPYELTPEEQKDKELLEFAERIHKMRVKRLSGAHIDNPPAINRLRDELGMATLDSLPKEDSDSVSTEHVFLSDDLDASQATIDEFVHSGVNLCFGILQVVISLLPPTIGAVLSAIGFRGSREDGLRLIWRATKERNVHGCIGLLALMFYYDGPFQFTDDDFDIPAATKSRTKRTNSNANSLRRQTTGESSNSLSKTMSALTIGSELEDDEMDAPTLLHPGKILVNALLQSRALFPNSALWLLNEARMLSSRGKLREAVQLMDSIDVNKIHMRQVKVMMVFDRANTLVHLHEYDRAADDLLSLLDFSDWSHALYTYYAGCCYLESYRMCILDLKDPSKAQDYKEKALKYIFSAPDHLGKKTFKAKNLPLDRFMLRKVEQFKAKQAELGVEDPLDAIATSPVHELAYFYNGYNRMIPEDLEITKKMLTEYKNPAIEAMDPNQELLRNLLLSLTMRRLGDIEEGCKLLDTEVLTKIISIDENGLCTYIKKTEDPWAYPAALYERALFCWKLNGMTGLPESKQWLDRATGYADDYELSSRIGMKIKAALDRVEHST
ncbi:Mitochondrial outer membrane protein iml2 [Maudiozyma exigua]|uniref:Mitochondrial outer membrane protein iml2 n=1 Tax=Maudiozyma exigua TaxID=34358 RepID=A0A9P6WDH4_MAUEX|nr:Mitochondrial outer membrane protein iml2 [Kazachstania exigua]